MTLYSLQLWRYLRSPFQSISFFLNFGRGAWRSHLGLQIISDCQACKVAKPWSIHEDVACDIHSHVTTSRSSAFHQPWDVNKPQPLWKSKCVINEDMALTNNICKNNISSSSTSPIYHGRLHGKDSSLYSFSYYSQFPAASRFGRTVCKKEPLHCTSNYFRMTISSCIDRQGVGWE